MINKQYKEKMISYKKNTSLFRNFFQNIMHYICGGHYFKVARLMNINIPIAYSLFMCLSLSINAAVGFAFVINKNNNFNILFKTIIFFSSLILNVLLQSNLTENLFSKVMIPASVKVLDTSVLININFSEYISRGFLDGNSVITDFVIQELNIMADSSDSQTRERGKIGLENACKIIKQNPSTTTLVRWKRMLRGDKVDELLVAYAESLIATTVKVTIVTADGNLEKVASCRGIKVININTMLFLLKNPIYVRDVISVFVVKKGERRNQAIGYSEDGTMLVIENAASFIGENIKVEINNIRSTESGRVVFCSFVSVNKKNNENAVNNEENKETPKNKSIVRKVLDDSMNERYERYNSSKNNDER